MSRNVSVDSFWVMQLLLIEFFLFLCNIEMCNARKLTRHHFSGFKSLTLSNFIASTKSVDYHSFGSFHFLVTRGEKKKREIDPVGKTWKHFQLSLPCLSTANIVVSVSIIQLGVCARREKNEKKSCVVCRILTNNRRRKANTMVRNCRCFFSICFRFGEIFPESQRTLRVEKR